MASYEVSFVGPGADVTDRKITVKQFEAIDVKAPRDLRWNQGATEVLDDPDESLLNYLKGDSDFKVTEVKSDATSEPSPKSKS